MRWRGLAVLLGCLGLTVEAAETAPAANDALLDLAGQAIAALQERMGADARVLRLHLGPDEATLDVQDPAKPAHVDRYAWWEGRLAGREPVAIGRTCVS